MSEQAIRVGASVGAISLIAVACAPQRLDGSGSAFVRQDVQPASRGGANFEFGDQQGAGSGQDGSGGSDRTLVIGLGIEIKGFSAMNNNQQKYVEDRSRGISSFRTTRAAGSPPSPPRRLDWTMARGASSTTAPRKRSTGSSGE